ncbi:MAG: hypothetical protein HYS21_14105 [Deltaproteobacteria bacterium]|nr:hypothetical protein [Deltaproteobacteria bacterium]
MNNDRMIIVFWHLTSGLTPLKILYNLDCFLKRDGTRVGWKFFLRGMRKLAENKYIKIISCEYASETYGRRAAILLPLGANFLCAMGSNLDPADFRMTCPKPANVDHEIRLTEIVNVIKTGSRLKQYELVSLSDDTQIRLWHKNRGESLKNKYIADLMIAIRLKGRDNRVIERGYHIEYENGNKGRSYWEPKLRSWEMNIILIVRDAKRAANLAKYIEGSLLGICIITHADFKNNGLMSCVIAIQRFQKSIFDGEKGEWKKLG